MYGTFIKNMSMNFWNLKHTKERLAILEKAEAQKRHLISLLKAKSVVAGQSNSLSQHSKSPSYSPTRIFARKENSFTSMEIRRNNNILYRKIANTQKLKTQETHQKTQCKFIDISREITRNHHVAHMIQKQMKQRKIDEENTKIFSRLIQTSPTLKRTHWIRANFETDKYKENLKRSKYAKPDYSVEACKLLSAQTNKKYTLKELRKNIGTAKSKYRNLKDSTLTNANMRG